MVKKARYLLLRMVILRLVLVGQEKKQRHEAAVRVEREILSESKASFESTQVSDSQVNLLRA